jgi:hypothetical protein
MVKRLRKALTTAARLWAIWLLILSLALIGVGCGAFDWRLAPLVVGGLVWYELRSYTGGRQ